ncbi:MAG: alpha/beta hydrolase [Pirellulales bacterium]
MISATRWTRWVVASAWLGTLVCATGPSVELTGAEPLPDPIVVRLWPERAPGETADLGPEKEVVRQEERKATRITNISQPTLSIYRAPPQNDQGTTVLVCPGGGYNYVVVDKEGTEAIAWLHSLGITGVLLKYRVPLRRDRPRHAAPLEDAQRALGLLRHRAAEWGGKGDRIGILGFSAGGHVAALASTRHARREYAPLDAADQVSCRPDFTLLIYPAYLTVTVDGAERLAPEVTVDGTTPPAFLVQTQDDSVKVESSLFYYLALQQAKVRGEMHVYPTGGHGYGLRLTGSGVAAWPDRAAEWLAAGGWR